MKLSYFKLPKYIDRKLHGGFREQLVFAFVVGILTTAIIIAFLISTFSSHQVEKNLESEGLQVSKDFAERNILALLYLSEESARENSQAIKNFPDVQGVAIYDAELSPLYEEGENTFTTSQEVWPNELKMIRESGDAWYYVSPVFAQTSDAELPFIDEVNEKELLGYVRVYVSKDTLRRLERNILLISIAISLLLSGLLLLILLNITDRLMNPLLELAGLMNDAESGNLHVRSRIWGPIDITNMQRAFNIMMRALADREFNLESARQAALQYAHAKGEFAANVSHELRTPLNGILGMLDILKETNLSPKQTEYVEVANDSGNALLSLIDDILNFSKVDSGKVQVEYESFNMREVLDDIISILTGQAQLKDIDIAYLINRDVPTRIKGDSSRLRQLLLNLGGNAVKFTPRGEVGFHVKNVTSGGTTLRLRFEIFDTGVGISEMAQEQIFDAFRQADESTTKQFGGTGLGLAICRQLVEIMHGDIGVKSRQGEGSTFWFELPFKDNPVKNTDTQLIQSSTASGMRIYIADDSEIIRLSMRQTFQNWGADVVCEENDENTIDVLRTATKEGNPFSVAFIDEFMNDVNGIELIRKITKDEEIKPLKLILLTNQSNPEAFLERFREIDTYIRKPVRQSSLFDSIAELINEPVEIKAEENDVEPKSSTEVTNRKTKFNATILVVEDNRANQQVIQAMLERVGCKSSVAANGIEALKLLENTHYDAVFMDCNMPQMDGYETTNKIRQFKSDKAQIPIIAMTANVLEGDREKCIQSGMDDYAEKPIKLNVLIEKLSKWVKTDVEEITESTSTQTLVNEDKQVNTEEHYAINKAMIDALRENMAGGFNDLIEMYIDDMKILLTSLEKSVKEEDAGALKHYAHTIKGSSANFGAERVVHIAKQLEEFGAENKLHNAGKLVQVLYSEADVAISELRKELNLFKDDTLLTQRNVERILIADDDRSMRVALQNVLASDGYEIESVSDGIEAVSRCEKNMPNLIILDALMPNLNGFEACKKIRMLQRSKYVPILIVTALEDEKSIEQAFECGATDYIPKPIHFAVMRQRVARLLKASRAEVHVRELAYNDSLTGLPNRTMFIDKMKKLLNKARPQSEMLAVMFLDLDRFKYVNDTLGHNVGDKLLKAVADRILSCVRSVDTVARLGGDEFTLAIDGIEDSNVVANIADKICKKVGERYTFAGKDIYVTASIGISMHPYDGDSVGELMKRADTAMFKAKEQGGSYLFYEEEMEVVVTNKVQTEQDLRRSIEREEMDVYFQPKLDLQTGIISGMEALVRWNHPERGLIAPGEFIPLAEETGLISDLGLWVLISACVQVQSWINKGYKPIPVSVNLSGKQLENSNISEQVAQVLKESGLKAEYLELEITESTIMKHPEDVITILHQLKDMGVKLSIDDFGTGYSSLNYLRKFPIDLLKIDASFVRDITVNNEDRLIAKGIIALAQSLNLKVLAEGVETAEQLELLREEGCDFIQGYHFGKPMKSEDFEKEFIIEKSANLTLISNFQK